MIWFCRIFPKKLHEIDKILVRRRGRVCIRPSLNPQFISLSVVFTIYVKDILIADSKWSYVICLSKLSSSVVIVRSQCTRSQTGTSSQNGLIYAHCTELMFQLSCCGKGKGNGCMCNG